MFLFWSGVGVPVLQGRNCKDRFPDPRYIAWVLGMAPLCGKPFEPIANPRAHQIEQRPTLQIPGKEGSSPCKGRMDNFEQSVQVV